MKRTGTYGVELHRPFAIFDMNDLREMEGSGESVSIGKNIRSITELYVNHRKNRQIIDRRHFAIGLALEVSDRY